jgi:hypothetical protein
MPRPERTKQQTEKRKADSSRMINHFDQFAEADEEARNAGDELGMEMQVAGLA